MLGSACSASLLGSVCACSGRLAAALSGRAFSPKNAASFSRCPRCFFHVLLEGSTTHLQAGMTANGAGSFILCRKCAVLEGYYNCMSSAVFLGCLRCEAFLHLHSFPGNASQDHVSRCPAQGIELHLLILTCVCDFWLSIQIGTVYVGKDQVQFLSDTVGLKEAGCAGIAANR